MTSLAAQPAQFALRGSVQKVYQEEDNQLSYWVIADTSNNKFTTFRIPAACCTPVDQLPSKPTPAAPWRMDGRAKATQTILEGFRSQMWGNDQPQNIQPPISGELTEVRCLEVLTKEIVQRIPVGNSVCFGPEQSQAFIHPALDKDSADLLREAFCRKVLQIVLWAPNHYGYLRKS